MQELRVFKQGKLFLLFQLAVTLIVSVFILASCSDSKDLGDGFRSSETKETLSTIPSGDANVAQPCSFLSLKTAASILGTAEKQLDELESSKPAKDTLRCRYSALSDDKKLFLVLNVYIYETQSAYETVKKANDGQDIETSVDEGFYFDKTNNKISERLVAARDGKNRMAISSSISIVDPNEKLKTEQITLPGLDVLATQLGLMLSEIK